MTDKQMQEPVAWMYWQSCLNDDGTQTAPWVRRYSKFKPPESVINKEITPLYTTTPAAQRQWVGLTDEEENALIPDPDGSAETNVRRVEVLPGAWGKEYEEVDA